LKKNRL
jgi:hypothetical protein